MSPKSNRSGISYDENDPRSLPMPGGVRVTRARDMKAAIAGLPTADEAAVEEYLAGDDREEIEERPRPDYSGWTKAQLNEELDRREIEHDPKANNPALVELLEKSDTGDTTPPSGD